MFWYQGQLRESNKLELSVNEPGLLYGATVFTTMRVYNQNLDHPLTNWELHKKRLSNALQAFNWPALNWESIIKGINVLLPKFPIIRITIFPDGSELILGRNLPENLAEKQTKGITAWLADSPHLIRSLPNYKTGNYLTAWLALQEAQKLGAQEAILIDNQGNWLESATGNLWGYKEGVYYTPALESGILPGVIRNRLLTWLNSHNIPIVENIWSSDFVQDLELIAYSNCAVEIIPFKSIKDNKNYLANFHYLNYLTNYFKTSIT